MRQRQTGGYNYKGNAPRRMWVELHEADSHQLRSWRTEIVIGEDVFYTFFIISGKDKPPGLRVIMLVLIGYFSQNRTRTDGIVHYPWEDLDFCTVGCILYPFSLERSIKLAGLSLVKITLLTRLSTRYNCADTWIQNNGNRITANRRNTSVAFIVKWF